MLALDRNRTVQPFQRLCILAGRGVGLAQRGDDLRGQGFVAGSAGLGQRLLTMHHSGSGITQRVVDVAEPEARAHRHRRVVLLLGQHQRTLDQRQVGACRVVHRHQAQPLHDVDPAHGPRG